MLMLGYTQTEVAEATGMSRGNVYRINVTYVKHESDRSEKLVYKKKVDQGETKEKSNKTWWESIKSAKYVMVEGEKCKVLQATDHHITFLKGVVKRCINRIDLYDNPELLEVV